MWEQLFPSAMYLLGFICGSTYVLLLTRERRPR